MKKWQPAKLISISMGIKVKMKGSMRENEIEMTKERNIRITLKLWLSSGSQNLLIHSERDYNHAIMKS
jgi:hypothetical protein